VPMKWNECNSLWSKCSHLLWKSHIYPRQLPTQWEPGTPNFMFCLMCISIYACNETNLMRYLSAVYSATVPLHADHHQEVTMYICYNWYVLYWKEDCLKLLEYLHVIIKCETYSCYLNLLKGIGKIFTYEHTQFTNTC
jgi:hypothetical protein